MIDRCIVCGKYVPEGRQVCIVCELKSIESTLYFYEEPNTQINTDAEET